MTWIRLAAARLENEQVLLQPLRENHRALLHPIAMDPRIWAHFTTMVETDEDFHNWFNSALAAQDAGRRVVFHITDKRSGAAAGSMSYCSLAEADRRLEIGASWLGTAFQGQGVNRWAKFLLMRHAFEELGAERVEFKTDVLNIKARRALSNIGAREEGVLRSYNFMPGGRRRDAVFYSVLRAEWPEVSQRLLTSEKTPVDH
jgi:RimJ/RimL family protein N-acetyltransferase